MISNISRRMVVLTAGFGAVLLLAACDSASSVTQPDAGRKSLQPTARHDDGDTLPTCLNGYIIIDGRTVCA